MNAAAVECVSDDKRASFALLRKHATHPFGSVCVFGFLKQLVSASPLAAAERTTFFFPLFHLPVSLTVAVIYLMS